MGWNDFWFPELKQFEPPQRERILREAKEEDFDTLEWVGLLAAIAAATIIVGRLDLLASANGSRVGSTVLSFLIALPLIGLLGGPFLIRRTRRGLRKRLENHRT